MRAIWANIVKLIENLDIEISEHGYDELAADGIDVRDALRRGDIRTAAKLGRVYKLTPVSTSILPEHKSFQSDPR